MTLDENIEVESLSFLSDAVVEPMNYANYYSLIIF